MKYTLICFVLVGTLIMNSTVKANFGTNSKLQQLVTIEKRLELEPGDPNASHTLEQLSGDNSAVVRAQAVYAVGAICNQNLDRLKVSSFEQTGWPIVLKGLADKDDTVRQAAYQVAASFQDKAAISLPYLEQGLRSDGSLGTYAADTLGTFGTLGKPAVAALIAQISDGPKQQGGSLVQVASANALAKLGRNAQNATSDLEGIIERFPKDSKFKYLIAKSLYRIDRNNVVAIKSLKELENGESGEFLASRAKSLLENKD